MYYFFVVRLVNLNSYYLHRMNCVLKKPIDFYNRRNRVNFPSFSIQRNFLRVISFNFWHHLIPPTIVVTFTSYVDCCSLRLTITCNFLSRLLKDDVLMGPCSLIHLIEGVLSFASIMRAIRISAHKPKQSFMLHSLFIKLFG